MSRKLINELLFKKNDRSSIVNKPIYTLNSTIPLISNSTTSIYYPTDTNLTVETEILTSSRLISEQMNSAVTGFLKTVIIRTVEAASLLFGLKTIDADLVEEEEGDCGDLELRRQIILPWYWYLIFMSAQMITTIQSYTAFITMMTHEVGNFEAYQTHRFEPEWHFAFQFLLFQGPILSI